MEKELIKNIESEEYDEEEDDDSIDSDEELSDDGEEEQENINVDEKKKRGRKPKPKEEEVDKIKKKRGRKPKVKEEIVEEKKPKKRGRKPKEKVYSVKELPKTFFEENKNETLILHLPIKPNEKMENPHPEASNNDTNFYNINNNEKIQDDKNLNTQSNLIEQNNIKVEENNGIHLFFDGENIDSSKNIFDNSIKIIKEQNNSTDIKPEYTSNVDIPIDSKYEDDCKNNRIIKKNLKNIMYEFINANNEKKWPESTNIHCWWCCNSFNDIPCALPEYYKKEKFYVNGCFCSFNCCASYNFSRNDDAMWERYSLLNLMYKKLYNKNFVKINLAPPRETLKMFGGFLSIEEFREYSVRNDKSFNIIKPPLISIIPKIEENIYINKITKTINQSTNESILNKTQNTLKLKRNKPITNPNSTLQSFMDFKII
jgi:hypothetical protein